MIFVLVCFKAHFFTLYKQTNKIRHYFVIHNKFASSGLYSKHTTSISSMEDRRWTACCREGETTIFSAALFQKLSRQGAVDLPQHADPSKVWNEVKSTGCILQWGWRLPPAPSVGFVAPSLGYEPSVGRDGDTGEEVFRFRTWGGTRDTGRCCSWCRPVFRHPSPLKWHFKNT